MGFGWVVVLVGLGAAVRVRVASCVVECGGTWNASHRLRLRLRRLCVTIVTAAQVSNRDLWDQGMYGIRRRLMRVSVAWRE